MEMHDMGTMPKETDAIPVSPSGNGKKKYYPTTYLSSKKLPGIEDYDIGDTINLHSVNKIIGKKERDDGEIEIEIETRQCGLMKGGDIPPKDEYDKLSEEEKDKMDEKDVMDKEEMKEKQP